MSKSIKRIKVKKQPFLETKEICDRFGIDYFVCPHNSETCKNILLRENIELGIVAGARILSDFIIDSVKIGILNLHPGIIPDVRGLDAIKWAVYNGQELGVTAHFIDKKIDVGKIIDIKKIKIERDDSWYDISQKMEELEIRMLIENVENVLNGTFSLKEIKDADNYNTLMDNKKELMLDKKLDQYLRRI